MRGIVLFFKPTAEKIGITLIFLVVALVVFGLSIEAAMTDRTEYTPSPIIFVLGAVFAWPTFIFPRFWWLNVFLNIAYLYGISCGIVYLVQNLPRLFAWLRRKQ